MSEVASLYTLFFSSLLAATLLPGGSEIILFAVIKAYPELLGAALASATVGNTLGGMVTFAMGWLMPQPVNLKHLASLRRYGTPTLLLAWVPLIGDGLCLAAGWLRFNAWQAALFMAAGKFARYWIISLAVS